jgi:hypothetical protein
MDRQIARLKKRLAKKAKRGFLGYPVGTLTCYGPDDRRASKLVAGIVEHEGGDAKEMRKWYCEQGDVRDNLEIIEEAIAFPRRRRLPGTAALSHLRTLQHADCLTSVPTSLRQSG